MRGRRCSGARGKGDGGAMNAPGPRGPAGGDSASVGSRDGAVVALAGPGVRAAASRGPAVSSPLGTAVGGFAGDALDSSVARRSVDGEESRPDDLISTAPMIGPGAASLDARATGNPEFSAISIFDVGWLNCVVGPCAGFDAEVVPMSIEIPPEVCALASNVGSVAGRAVLGIPGTVDASD